MTMHTFLLSAENWYLVCFGVGLVLSLLTFFGGFGHLHIGHLHSGHLHLAHSHAGHAHAHAPRASGHDASISPLNGFTLMAFLCWFGGTGYLLRRFTGVLGLGVFAIAVISGLAGAAVIFWFLARVLLPSERVLTAEETEMTGVLARVSSPIREGGTGEIAYSQGGAHRAAAARSDAGAAIPRDVEVVVLRYERGIAYVRPWSELEGPPAI
jgi:membrane protein implicated in regulation of membrane protease activity